MKSENIFKGVNQQIKVFDSAGDKKIFGRLSHFRRSVYGIRICFEIMKFHFDEMKLHFSEMEFHFVCAKNNNVLGKSRSLGQPSN